VSAAWQFYISTLLVYLGVNVMAGWALNLQFGYAGIMTFCFIVFQAIGAYVAAVATLGPSNALSYQHYISFGATLPWPVAFLLAGIAGGLLAFIIGSFALRGIPRGLQAMVMIIVSIIAIDVVSEEVGLFNGDSGLSSIPKPFSGALGLGLVDYSWFYVVLTAAICGIAYFVVHRLTSGPYGRKLRAVRENPISAASVGVNVRKETMIIFVVGGALAGFSGAVLVGYIGAWSTGAWSVFETFALFAALTVGGLGNNAGAVLGVAVVLTGILQGVTYLPILSTGALIGALQEMSIGILLVLFMWFRPQGLVPERRRILSTMLNSSSTGELSIGELNPSSTGQLRAFSTGVRKASSTGELRRWRVKLQEQRGVPEVQGLASEKVGLLEIVAVTESFGGALAVDNVSFSIPKGQIIGLIGPNGAGKTTIINLIAGTEFPDRGSIYYQGRDISKMSTHQRANRGLIRTFQLASEFSHLTVLENVMVAVPEHRGAGFLGAMGGKRYWRSEERQNLVRAKELLEKFQLTHLADQYAADLSGGQKRLLELARALMAEPELLLLDEPFAGVAPGLRPNLERHLIALRDEGLTIMMVEHELGTIERCTDSVIVMSLGRVLAVGRMDELRGRKEVADAFLVRSEKHE
jgi:ABC-type branched-subunit amino acid transport system ATPase component/ABC-type branched-subunit amino acid transport system permease subunit